MKLKNLSSLLIIFGLITCVLPVTRLHAQVQDPAQMAEALAREFIPAEILTILKDGLESRTPRTDVPIDIFKYLYLPAQQNMHGIFFFKCKNADLGFEGVGQAGEEEVSAFETTPTQLVARNNIFVYIKQVGGEYEKQIYIPFNQKADGMNYNPEATPYYSFGYPLPPGDYVLALAIASPDQQRIGTQYMDFSLPDAMAFTDIEITPPFFINKMNEMTAVEMQPEVHKGFFTYSLYQMDANIEHVFPPGGTLDVFFYIFGVQPNAAGTYDLEINYSILQGEDIAIRYATTNYEHPVVSQPLPMKKTVIIKTTDEQGNESESQEQRDLEAGSYTFSIEIKDNLSGKTTTKTVPIEVR